MSEPKVERREVAAQPVVFIRRDVARAGLADAIGECLGAVYLHCQNSGLAFGGPPFTRYTTMADEHITVEIGMPLAASAGDGKLGDGGIEAGFLAGGPVACAVHVGDYAELGTTYAALERWMAANGCRAAGAPWESYVTDPGDHPDTADWRTEVYWPILAE
jgi:effector-binding domain-containing protein